MNLVVIGTMCGWLMIRDNVLEKLKLCKDLEYVCIIHILEEILPMVFFQYTLVFRPGNLNEYQDVMFRFLIAFIIWDRHHYDRATLSMLNDLYHQKNNYPDYHNFKTKWLALLTEKKGRNMSFLASLPHLQLLYRNRHPQCCNRFGCLLNCSCIFPGFCQTIF